MLMVPRRIEAPAPGFLGAYPWSRLDKSEGKVRGKSGRSDSRMSRSQGSKRERKKEIGGNGRERRIDGNAASTQQRKQSANDDSLVLV